MNGTLELPVGQIPINHADVARVEATGVERGVGHDHRDEDATFPVADPAMGKPIGGGGLNRRQERIGAPLQHGALLVLRLKHAVGGLDSARAELLGIGPVRLVVVQFTFGDDDTEARQLRGKNPRLPANHTRLKTWIAQTTELLGRTG